MTESAASVTCPSCRGTGRDPLDSTMSCHRCGGVKVIRVDEKAEGLLEKYHVERRNDPTGKHDDCRYFVLDPKHDLIARRALSRYAQLADGAGYEDLADDLRSWIRELNAAEGGRRG